MKCEENYIFHSMNEWMHFFIPAHNPIQFILNLLTRKCEIALIMSLLIVVCAAVKKKVSVKEA